MARRRKNPAPHIEVRDLDSLLEEVKAVAEAQGVRPEFSRDEVEDFVDYVVGGLSTLPDPELVRYCGATWVKSATCLEFDGRGRKVVAREVFGRGVGMPLGCGWHATSPEQQDELAEARWEPAAKPVHSARLGKTLHFWVFVGAPAPWELRSNPSSVVRTKRDEHLWEQAKAVAADAGRKGDWAYVMGVFKKSRGRKTRSNPETLPLPKAAPVTRVGDQLHVGYLEVYETKDDKWRALVVDRERQEAHKSDLFEDKSEGISWAKHTAHGVWKDRGYKLAAIRSKGTTYKSNVWVAAPRSNPAGQGTPPSAAEVAQTAAELDVPKNLRTGFMRGMEVEWHEHGGGLDLRALGQLVLDHLTEDPRYYRRARGAQ